MSDKVMIKNKGDLYEIHPKDLVNSFKEVSEEERVVTPPKTLKGLKYIKKINNNEFSFCFEFENLSKEISVKIDKSSISEITYSLTQIVSRLEHELSSESVSILKEHLIKRQHSYQQYLNAVSSINYDYYHLKIPVNFYHKVYLYGKISLPSNSNEYLIDCEFEILSQFSNHEKVQYIRNDNRIILPNIYSGNNLCLGSNSVKKYDKVNEYRDVLEMFKDSLFNEDLNTTHNRESIKNSLRDNIKYIIKNKIKDENLKKAYIELFQDSYAIDSLIRSNDSWDVYNFINLFYLFDVD